MNGIRDRGDRINNKGAAKSSHVGRWFKARSEGTFNGSFKSWVNRGK